MFAIASLIVAVVCLGKGGTALLMPERFYRWRQTTQYDSEKIPPIVLIMPILMLLLAAQCWYTTFTQYQPWSWIITGFTTLIAFFAVVNLSRWSSHRKKVGALIETQKEKRVATDLLLSALGVFFFYLGVFIY